MKNFRLNIPYLIVFCAIFAVEVVIALFIRDRFIRPYLGDVLVVILLYCLIRAVWQRFSRLLPLWVFLFAAFVEVLQYFHIVERLHLEQYGVLRVILGSTFDTADLVCYAAGAGVLFLWQALERRLKIWGR